MAETVKVLCLLVVLGLSLVKGFDPCFTDAVLGSQERRCPSEQATLYGVCDRYIAEGWYRVADGSDIPTSCQTPYHCGTNYPVWMDGSVPSVSDGVVYRKVCVSDTTCCAATWTIGVKNCGSYRVYYLKKTNTCPSAYCIEKRVYTTTTDTSSEESSSSSSQDITSSSSENTERVSPDVITTNETFTDSKPSGDSGFIPTTATQMDTTKDNVKNSVAGGDKAQTTSSPDYTQSQVLTEDSPDVMLYVILAVVGVLCVIIILGLVVIWRLRRGKKRIPRKDSQDRSRSPSSNESSNHYSDLPNPETIYYSIDYDKETENNIENEKRASAHDRDMYLDALHCPNPNKCFNDGKKTERTNSLVEGLNNRDMYLDMSSKPRDEYQEMNSRNIDMYVADDRNSSQSQPIDDVTEYNSPYECSSKDEESHDYAGLPKEESNMSVYSNDGYEQEECRRVTDNEAENENRLSTVSYDDVTFDIK